MKIFFPLFCPLSYLEVRGVVTASKAHWTPVQGVRIQALPWFMVLCSYAGHFAFAVPCSTQERKGVQSNLFLWTPL